MDPDHHSLADRGSGSGSRADAGIPSRAQAEQDAWVCRWPGWAERGGPPPDRVPPSPGPMVDRVRVGRRRLPFDYRPGRRATVFGAVSIVVGLGLLAGLLVRVPYVALVPGSARDTEPLLAIAGIDDFPSDGELLLTTVRVRQRPNLWEYLWLSLDDDAEVVPEGRILGDRTPQENRDFNLSLMSDSKQVAVAVALEELGYDAISTDGVVVSQLVPDTPAEDALELGDTIVAIDREATTTTGRLVEILSGHRPGDRIELTVESFDGSESETVVVTLAANPDDPAAGFLGIQPFDRIRYGTDLGFTVEIDSGSVGGPSAGLAFTLAILDQLTAGELTGGRTVAVTGTIQPDGSVGPVGGVQQKAAAVRSLGVDTFIVPAQLGEVELAAVAERAGDQLTVIPVADLDEALAALAGLGGDVGAVEEFAAANPQAAG